MTRSRSPLLLPALLGSFVLALAILAPKFASAQGLGSSYEPHILPSTNDDKPSGQQAPPPAVPGARTNLPAAAQADKTATDLAPNEALFDAINRGDNVAARDALNRGAELSARNVLGMTPLELSVDLGRDDISFLLLSMRGADNSSRPPPAPPATKIVAKPETKTRAAAARAAVPERRPMPVSEDLPATPRAPQPAATAALPAGTPDPAAGFLGFGGH